ncbi:hypothetical protein [Phaeobacter italicus]|uniref:hypothetical protein n=1 Tax=Phaeobacter italicus TaxID=481446 RepID=UPI001C95EAEE|nr:hypothetical protein [Phaeobacter italicus]MBY6045811.1 hypothetical protein [Phaeobacter italicus]
MSAMEQLTAASVRLQQTADLFQQGAEKINNLFLQFPPDMITTHTVGPDGTYPDLEAAWLAIKDVPIFGKLVLKVLPDHPDIDKRVVIGPHAYASNLSIEGEPGNPSAVNLTVLDSAGDPPSRRLANGIEFSGMVGMRLNGIKFVGSGTGSNVVGLSIFDGSYILSDEGTVEFEGLNLGVFAKGGVWDTKGVKSVGCDSVVYAEDGGVVLMNDSDLTGNGPGTGAGLRANGSGHIDAGSTRFAQFRIAALAAAGGTLDAGNHQVEDCWMGMCAKGGTVTCTGDGAGSAKAARCQFGYYGEEAGQMRAEGVTAENCRQAAYATGQASLKMNNTRIIENNTALVPNYSSNAYFFEAVLAGFIETGGTSYQHQRSSSYRIRATSNGYIV